MFLLFSPICCYWCYLGVFIFVLAFLFLAVVCKRVDRKSMFQLLSYCSYCNVLSKTGYKLPSRLAVFQQLFVLGEKNS